MFANFNLNGGTNGSGGVELVYFDDGNYAALQQAPAAGYITDTGTDDAGRAFNQGATAEQNAGGHHYNSQTHQMTLAVNRYFAIHSVDDAYYKLRITSFAYSGPGSPMEIVFDWQEIDAP